MKSIEFITESSEQDIVAKWTNQGAQISLHKLNNGTLELSKIIIPKEARNKGIGSKFMQDLINYADQNNIRIVLSPATDFGASSVSRLINFYKNFGFVQNAGKNKDFEITQSMYRNPTQP